MYFCLSAEDVQTHHMDLYLPIWNGDADLAHSRQVFQTGGINPAPEVPVSHHLLQSNNFRLDT